MEIKIFGYDAAAVVGVLKVVEEKEKLLNEIMKLSRPERENLQKLCRLVGGFEAVEGSGSVVSAISPEEKEKKTSSGGSVNWKGTHIGRSALESVREVVRKSGDCGVTVGYVAGILEYKKTTIYVALKYLENEGFVRCEQNRSGYVYRMVSSSLSEEGGEDPGDLLGSPSVTEGEGGSLPSDSENFQGGEDLSYRVMGYMTRPVTYDRKRVAKALNVPMGALDAVLKDLSEAGIVRITGKKGYVIPSATLVGDLILGAVSTGDPQTVEKICVNIGGYVSHWIVVEVLRELAAAGKVKINSMGLVYRN